MNTRAKDVNPVLWVGKGNGIMNAMVASVVQFLKEALAELRKVSWLSRKEVVASTIVVIILVILVAIFVGFTDFILARVLGVLL